MATAADDGVIARLRLGLKPDRRPVELRASGGKQVPGGIFGSLGHVTNVRLRLSSILLLGRWLIGDVGAHYFPLAVLDL